MPVLQTLKEKALQQPQIYTHCTLMLDGMKLHEKVSFERSGEASIGFVDLGGVATAEEEFAKEALVLMLVGLNGHWKAPIAYFLTKGKWLLSIIPLQEPHHNYKKYC